MKREGKNEPSDMMRANMIHIAYDWPEADPSVTLLKKRGHFYNGNCHKLEMEDTVANALVNKKKLTLFMKIFIRYVQLL